MPQIFLSHFISVLVTALSNERRVGFLLGVLDLQILCCSQALVPSAPKVSSHRIVLVDDLKGLFQVQSSPGDVTTGQAQP